MTRPSGSRRVLSTSPFAPPVAVPAADTRMSPGSRVTHDRHGLGVVVRIIDDHDVIVNFRTADGAHRSVPHTQLTLL